MDNFKSTKEDNLNTCNEFVMLAEACQTIVDAENKRAEAYIIASRVFMTNGRKIGISKTMRRLGKKLRAVAGDLGSLWSELHNQTVMGLLDIIIKENQNSLKQETQDGEEKNDSDANKSSSDVMCRYEEDECRKLYHLKTVLVDFLDRLETALPRITCNRATKGSHFGTTWLDIKGINPEEIVKQRISENVTTSVLSKEVVSAPTVSIETTVSEESDKAVTRLCTWDITPVSLMCDVTVIAVDNFKKCEKNQISLRRGMILRQILAANQDGFSHGYKSSGKWCSGRKYGYYPSNKVVLYEPQATGDWNLSKPVYLKQWLQLDENVCRYKTVP